MHRLHHTHAPGSFCAPKRTISKTPLATLNARRSRSAGRSSSLECCQLVSSEVDLTRRLLFAISGGDDCESVDELPRCFSGESDDSFPGLERCLAGKFVSRKKLLGVRSTNNDTTSLSATARPFSSASRLLWNNLELVQYVSATNSKSPLL